MSKYPSQIHKLDKETQKRHFSFELGLGKGSAIRGNDPQSKKNYEDNYDRIFGKKDSGELNDSNSGKQEPKD